MLLSRTLKWLTRPLLAIPLAVAIYTPSAIADTFNLTVFPSVQQVSHSAQIFDDRFEFTVLSPADIATSAVSINLKLGGMDVYHITNFRMGLYSTLNPLQPIASTSGNPIDLATSLQSGSYFAKVTGVTDGTAGGSYLFSWAMAASPVPEPESYVMLIAGLGLIGFMSRRRR